MDGLSQPLYPWPYVDGLAIDEAANELAFMTTGLYGKSLPPQNGGPIRMTTPWKYGFKQVKSIIKVTFTEKRPRCFWQDINAGEYGRAVHDAMAEGSWARLKACPADNCLWAFYDETKNRSGTWCSMSVCGNRTKARAYRRRHPHAEHMEKTRAV